MGTKERKGREKELRKKQIRDAAKFLFMTKGFSSTTMEDIAKRAELSLGAIYQYFGNKSELYASLNLETLEFWHARTAKVFNNDKLSVEAKIRKYKDAMLETYEYDPLMMKNILHVQLEDTLSGLNPMLLNQLNRIATEIMSMIANTFSAGMGEGKVRKYNCMALADILWSMFSGLVLWEEAKRAINPKKDFLKTTLNTGIEVFWLGINLRR